MSSIILYLGLCLVGYLVAIPLRKYEGKMAWIGPLQNLAVLLLVFTMGARVGSNSEVVKNLGKYGVYALIFTLNISIFSLIACSIARRGMGIDRYGQMRGQVGEEGVKDQGHQASGNGFTLMIALAVGVGIFTGHKLFGLWEASIPNLTKIVEVLLSLELCLLLFFVGLDMGLSGQVLDNFKKVGLRVLVIPISIILGTLAGALVTGILLPLEIKEALAIGAGLGWYSLGPAIMMDGGMVTGGAISFLHNLMREFSALLLIPIIAKKIGYVEAVALPGSTAMDVSLPVVARSTNSNIAVYSFVSGAILSAAVPALVGLFV